MSLKNHFTAKNCFIAFILIYIVLLFTNGVPFVYSDGYCYYHIARSIVDKGNFVQYERPEYLDYRGHVIAYYQGKYADVCSPGTAFVNVPGLLISKQFRNPNQTIYNDYFLGFNGHTLADGTAVLLTAFFTSILSIYLLYKLARLYEASEKLALGLTFAIFVSSYTVWYVFLNSTFTHTYEFFSVILLMWAYKRFENSKFKSKRFGFWMGVASSFGFVTRPLIIFPAFFYGLRLVLKKKFKALFIYGVSNIPFLLFWMAYNYVSYGSPITSGYNEIRGENFKFTLDNFHFFDVLFSPQRGWYIYSPLFLIGTIGLIISIYKGKYVFECISALATIFLIAFTYGFWPAWWGGGSYGARFLIVLAPFTIFGLIFLFQNLKKQPYKILLILCTVFTLYTGVLTVLYRFTPIANLRPKEDQVGIMRSGDRYTPIDIFAYHINLVKNSSSAKDYFTRLYKSASGGNSYIVFPLGIADTVFRMDDREANKFIIHLINPPFKSQKDSEYVNLFIYHYGNLKTYSVTLHNSDESQPYVFDVTVDSLSSKDIRIKIEEMKTPPPTLSFDKYTGIRMEKLPIAAYFENSFNIQFKGPPINKPPTSSEYTIGE